MQRQIESKQREMNGKGLFQFSDNELANFLQQHEYVKLPTFSSDLVRLDTGMNIFKTIYKHTTDITCIIFFIIIGCDCPFLALKFRLERTQMWVCYA